jgi:hypothetical protein
MLTNTESFDVGAAGVWLATLTETGGADVFITESVRSLFNNQARIRNE